MWDCLPIHFKLWVLVIHIISCEVIADVVLLLTVVVRTTLLCGTLANIYFIFVVVILNHLILYGNLTLFNLISIVDTT